MKGVLETLRISWNCILSAEVMDPLGILHMINCFLLFPLSARKITPLKQEEVAYVRKVLDLHHGHHRKPAHYEDVASAINFHT